MIIACETFFNDGGHVPINAGLLAIIRAAFPQEEVLFFGAGTHIEELKKQLGALLTASIAWMEIVPPDRTLTYFRRLFGEMKIMWNLMRTFPQNCPGLLVLTSAYPSTVVALKLVKACQSKRVRVQLVLHGGSCVSGVTGRRHRHPIRRFQEMKTALTLFGNNNVQYLVLEECIRDILLKNLNSLSGEVKTIDHPLPPNEAESNINDLCTPVRFGFLGLANGIKGFPLFVKLAGETRTKYQEQVEFHVIGRVTAEANPMLEMDALATKPGMTRMSRVDFIQGIKPLHFIIFPNDAGHYELSPSGTLLDAIAWEKPLIARRIPIFENMFKRYGDIGYLFSSDMELREIVEQIVKKRDQSHYHRQVLNLRKARDSRLPEALAPSYRAISMEA